MQQAALVISLLAFLTPFACASTCLLPGCADCNYSSDDVGVTCLSCNSGYVLALAGCFACPSNCDTCSVPSSLTSAAKCTTCNKGYGLGSDGNCYECLGCNACSITLENTDDDSDSGETSGTYTAQCIYSLDNWYICAILAGTIVILIVFVIYIRCCCSSQRLRVSYPKQTGIQLQLSIIYSQGANQWGSQPAQQYNVN